MAATDFFSNFHLLIRWLHVFAGIVWVGHLYFFNFVNLPFQGSIDDPTKKAVNAKLILRALWWFRWGAMITWVAGLLLFTMNYMYTPGVGFGPSPLWGDETGLTSRAVWISLGMTLGTVMWFNVWMIIWPTQRRLFSGLIPAEQVPAARARAAFFSRINTFLSGPMLFGMLAPAHYTQINALTLLVFVLLGLAPIPLLYKASKTAGASAP
ncbi:MAG: urate hydroxylase PuuD, partial [Elusimicrobiota bacterium]